MSPHLKKDSESATHATGEVNQPALSSEKHLLHNGEIMLRLLRPHDTTREQKRPKLAHQ
jgi:hypothetical protein